MRKVLYTLYGAASYTLFLAVLVYFVGWVADVVVPKTINSGDATSLPFALAVDIGLVLLFGLQHSIMARPTFKRVWTKIVPKPIERATYVLATSAVLVAMMAWWQPIHATVWDVTNPTLRAIVYGLTAAGFGLVLYVTFLINHFDLFGLRQVWLYLLDKTYTGVGFKMPWLYRHVRHPLYVGWMASFWFIPTMTVGHLIFAAGMSSYMIVAIFFEERNLVDEHGSRYEEYRRRTPKLIPSLRPAMPAIEAAPSKAA